MKCDYCNHKLEYENGVYSCPSCKEYKQSANIDLMNSVSFEENELLIYDRAWEFARKYNMNFEDLKSEAFLIFCEALERFNGRSSFSTFLYNRLWTLNDYCLREKARANRSLSLSPGYYNIPEENEDDPTRKIIFYDCLKRLSGDGRRVVQGILYGTFERPGAIRKTTISKSRVMEISHNKWGWTWEHAENIWDELQEWWNENEEVLIY